MSHLPKPAFREYHVVNNESDQASGILTIDGVHLNQRGNKFVADQILQTIR